MTKKLLDGITEQNGQQGHQSIHFRYNYFQINNLINNIGIFEWKTMGFNWIGKSFVFNRTHEELPVK